MYRKNVVIFYIIIKILGTDMKYFNLEHPELMIVNPIHYPRDKLTGNIIRDKNPWIYVKLLLGYKKTEFLYPDSNDTDPISECPNLKSIKFESINVQRNIVVIYYVIILKMRLIIRWNL